MILDTISVVICLLFLKLEFRLGEREREKKVNGTAFSDLEAGSLILLKLKQ